MELFFIYLVYNTTNAKEFKMIFNISHEREVEVSEANVQALIEDIIQTAESEDLAEYQGDSYTWDFYQMYLKKNIRKRVDFEKEDRELDLQIRALQARRQRLNEKYNKKD